MAEQAIVLGMDMDTQSDLDSARALLQQGNFAQAEIHLRQYWELGGSDSSAMQLLSMIARGYGVDPSFRLCEKSASNSSFGTEPRYLLIKAWGHGFWSDVHHVLGQLLLAELLDRTPIVQWGDNSLFRENDDPFNNSYPHFFIPPSSVTIDNLPLSISVFPDKWNRGNLNQNNVNKLTGAWSRLPSQLFFNRPEQLVVNDFYMPIKCLIPWIAPESKYFGKDQTSLYRLMAQKYLKPSKAVQFEIDSFYSKHMAGKDWLALHIRGSDKVYEDDDLERTNRDYQRFIERIIALNPDIGIFLLTDSEQIHSQYIARFGSRLLSTNATRSQTDLGVHYSGLSGIKIGSEVVIDAFLASRCDYFVGNRGSNVSLGISVLKDWPHNQMFLLGGVQSDFYHYISPPTPVSHCRLCSGPTRIAFNKLILGTLPVNYHQCVGCRALQTEEPHWLDKAYSHRAEMFDTGKASRTLINFLALPKLFQLLGVRQSDRAVDVGGGTGLFGRLMRDIGYNFYTHDKYGSSEFMGAFECKSELPPCKLITLFEVAEHFSNPLEEWRRIFACNPDWVIGSTGIYNDQGADWPYLSTESGQHVFFYSTDSIAFLAQSSGRFAYIIGMYFLISKNPLSEELLAEISEWEGQPYEVCKNTFNGWIGAPYLHATQDNSYAATLSKIHQAGKKIAIDGTFFRFATGISRVWKTLLAHWSSTMLGEHLVIIDRGKTAPRFPGLLYVDAPLYDYAQADSDRQLLQDLCEAHGVGLFISTYYTIPISTPSALMVLDMIPEVMGYDLENPQWQAKRRAIEYASYYLTISQNTERDLIRFYPSTGSMPQRVAYCGTDFRPAPTEKVSIFKARYGVSRPYFLISGVRDGPKNADLFFRAFSQLGERRSEFAIVCTNADSPLDPEHATLAEGASVHMMVLNDEELQCAYSAAVALVYPSRYEGFGLPVLEAMACNCPVITCKTSSIPEVAGDAAIYVNPDDASEMHRAILDVLTPTTRDNLIERGALQASKFSWSTMAREVGGSLANWVVTAEAKRGS